MRKIIFLDIDGVLNSDDFYKNTRGKGLDTGQIDEQAVLLLNQLEDCEVVISSSWGNSCIEPLIQLGLKLPIIDITEHYSLSREWIVRGNEIKKWIIEHDKDNEEFKYVIFDDDSDMLLEQKDNFIQTDWIHGLTQEDVNKAKIILDIKNNN